MSRLMNLLLIALVCSILMPVSVSAQGEILDAIDFSCPDESQSLPSDAPNEAVEYGGHTAVPRGEPLLVSSGGPDERTLTLVASDYLWSAATGEAANKPAIVFCIEVMYSNDATVTAFDTGNLHLFGRGESRSSRPDLISNNILNGDDPEGVLADLSRGQLPSGAVKVQLEAGVAQVLPIAFFSLDGQTDLVLTSGTSSTPPDPTKTEWAMLASVYPLSESGARASQDAGEIPRGTVTEFNQPTVVTLGLEKWRLTFDPNVEVRYFIGDASITPTRGQFLVIWFDQFSPQGEPMPLGNFTLQTSAAEGEPFAVRPLSQEGTLALALTEYTWTPNTMSANTEYRTGIAFDIAPEDTHFVLQYRGPSGGLGADYAVDLEFDA